MGKKANRTLSYNIAKMVTYIQDQLCQNEHDNVIKRLIDINIQNYYAYM